VKIGGCEQERHVNRGQVMSESAGQVDVGDRAVVGTEAFSDIGERAAKAVGGEDQGLTRDHACRDSGPAARTTRESRVEQVEHARLDGEPGQEMNRLGHLDGRVTMRCLTASQSPIPGPLC
jgi:hypothetical protein